MRENAGGFTDDEDRTVLNETSKSLPVRRFQMFKGTVVLTDGDEGRDDGDGQRRDEQVDGSRQEGHLPGAGVSQADHISVSVMHLNMSLNTCPRRERAAHLRDRERQMLRSH